MASKRRTRIGDRNLSITLMNGQTREIQRTGIDLTLISQESTPTTTESHLSPELRLPELKRTTGILACLHLPFLFFALTPPYSKVFLCSSTNFFFHCFHRSRPRLASNVTPVTSHDLEDISQFTRGTASRTHHTVRVQSTLNSQRRESESSSHQMTIQIHLEYLSSLP